MKRNRPAPRTAAQQQRFNAIKRLGCLVAYIRGEGFVPCEIHHLTKLGKRDHDKTIGLSPWRHRGELPPGYTTTLATKTFGPSLAKGSKAFHLAYGTDEKLLERQNALLGVVRVEPAHRSGKTFQARPRADRKPTPRCAKVLPPRAATWKPKP